MAESSAWSFLCEIPLNVLPSIRLFHDGFRIPEMLS
jgi:hypothetical protein